MHAFQDALLGLGLCGLATSTVYGGLVVRASLGFRREQEEGTCTACSAPRDCATAGRPAVSILKPLHGREPGLDAHLESFFNQRYPTYEILFCARSAEDPGLKTARAVAARHPEIPTRFFTSGEPPYANAKVASLETMYRHARHDVLIVSDSDVHVQPDYLGTVVAPFSDPMVGAVTCLYRGIVAGKGNSVWAYLEGVGMSVEMPAGVLVARMLEGMQFLLGPTMAVRRKCVQEIGGFQTLGQYCSDDFLLGKWVAERGHEVVLSTYVVDHVILNMGFLDSVKHQVRWMKSTRCSRPKGHFGSALTFAMPYAFLASSLLLCKGHAELAALVLCWGVLSRILLAGIVGGMVVKESALVRSMLLHPLRDLLGFAYWLASYTSNRIVWRGQEYELMEEGRMQSVHSVSHSAGPSDSLNKKQEPALTH